MERYGESFKGGKPTRPCLVCQESTDTQSHSFQCKVVRENVTVNGNYIEIFSTKGDKKLAESIIENIAKFREGYMEN